MKKLIFLFLFAVTVLACQTKAEDRKDGFTVTGKVKTPQKGKVVLHILGKQGFQPVDSVALAKDNTYTLKGKTAEPRFYMLDFYDVQKVLVILANGDNITVDVDGNNPNGAFTMKGSAEVEQLEKVVKVQNNFQAKAAALQADFQKAAAKRTIKPKKTFRLSILPCRKIRTRNSRS